jgi:hypothetical protein
MKFIPVNDRKLRLQSFCAVCGETLRDSYARAIGTRLTYCDYRCYGSGTLPTTQSWARAS